MGKSSPEAVSEVWRGGTHGYPQPLEGLGRVRSHSKSARAKEQDPLHKSRTHHSQNCPRLQAMEWSLKPDLAQPSPQVQVLLVNLAAW